MRRTVTDFFSAHQGLILQIILGVVMVLFIGILITTYVVAKRANPIFLDESGKPVGSQTDTRSY